ncbi:hypothetical protein Tsubulata_009498 [Turnera subulata]|uniref:CCT domain-containing protein n=1 Tax=Turnera subulata TaxID=218843 RepID=A0A9Q0J4E2_9ROSI|nr:hypothetical protein Tsubulata_009498 [Turnera subulata]
MMLTTKNHALRSHVGKDDVSSPISAQILEFCDSEFFQETLQNTEVTSSSHCCYEENSPYTTNLSLQPDIEKFNSFQDNNGHAISTTPTTTSTSTTTTQTSTGTTATVSNNNINNNNNSLSIIFDSQDELDNDISASIDFSSSPTLSVPHYITTQQDQFDFSSVQPQLTLTDVVSSDGLSQYSADPVPQLMVPPLSSVFEEDCMSSVPSYVPLNNSSPSCSFLSSAINSMTSALSAETSGTFAGGILMGSQWQTLDLDYQGDNGGIYCPDSVQRGFNPGDLQVFCNETQQLGAGAVTSTPLTSEISSLEDSAFKVGKLSVEQRKEKIHRYMKKRNERNFSKKIKYACRKTLADSRPRVRGRFAKNDDFGETHRAACSNHEEDDDDEQLYSNHILETPFWRSNHTSSACCQFHPTDNSEGRRRHG